MSSTEVDLDRAYSPSMFSHRFTDRDKVIESHVNTLTRASERARSELPCLLNSIVDPTTSFSDHSIDIYFPSNFTDLMFSNNSQRPCALLVYIHGGFWQFFSRRESAFMAQTMADEQIATVVLGYPIAPQATIDQIVICVEQSMVKILKWAETMSVKVFICGHSAGAHLASTLFLVDWKSKYDISHEIFGDFFLISGVYDLVPLVSTYINQPLGMTISTAQKQSPLHRHEKDFWLALKHVPILCVHAQYDSPTFHEQNQQFGSYLKTIGFDQVQIIQMDNFDHFDVIEQLEKRDQPLTNMILKLIKDSFCLNLKTK